MKRQPLGILLFPLKKSMKEVLLFDRGKGGNRFKLKIHLGREDKSIGSQNEQGNQMDADASQ